MKALTSLALCLFCVTSFSSIANSNLPDNRHISVTGTAKMMAKPDIALVHLSVESIKKTSIDAKQDVDQRVNNLLDGLKKFNIDEKDVSASNISTEAKYSYARNDLQKLEGYVARRTLKVTLNNINNLNAFMDYALSVNVNEIRNIELKSSNELALKDEAIALAVKNAKEKGHSLANAFDAKLGKIYSINANSHASRHRYGANSDIERIEVSGSRMSNSLAKPGKYLQENIVFSSSVSVVFDLEI
jgi:uncharacterized protein YggE